MSLSLFGREAVIVILCSSKTTKHIVSIANQLCADIVVPEKIHGGDMPVSLTLCRQRSSIEYIQETATSQALKFKQCSTVLISRHKS